ncbi:hypothetical protein [Aquabacter cavernae]|uniref:hypothetical protein n=1 Tax=Aquabacter cavernae TaxID=2496029 RepID=UPI000F8E0B03|nr:hypothetical protein [Aquabacter cavernae]
MATTMTVNLSSTLRSQLNVDGVYLTVLIFSSGSDSPVYEKIYAGNGTQDGPIDLSFDVPLTTGSETLNGGKVYFIIQSTDSATPLTFASQSQINWQSAAENSYRYDSVEISLLNASGDAANLTSVEGFGIPMELSAATGTRSYNVTGQTLLGTDLPATSSSQVVYQYTEGPLAGQDRMAISPTAAVPIGNAAFSADDWSGYITSLQGSSASDIVLNGFFNGAPDVEAGSPAGTVGQWRNAGYFNYQLEWDATNQVFWLAPGANSQIQGYIKITAAQLQQSIYSSLGTVEIYTNQTDAEPYMVYATGDDPTSTMNVGANNQWGKILQQFTNGFTAGYYGVTGASLNDQVQGAIDLNKNYNWDPTYAFANNMAGSNPVFYDHYSKVFFDNTNSYGSTYSDALMAAFNQGGPLLPVYQNGANLTSLTLNMYADGETPAGYVQPSIFNYIGPTNGTTYDMGTYQGNGQSITLDFGSGQAMVLSDDVPIYFKFISAYDDGNTPTWTSLQLGSSTETPWQTWTVNESNGVYSVVGNGGVGQSPSSLVLVNPPVAASAVNWYQIVVGEGATQKIYNVYATTNGTYEFVDPTSTSDVTYAADGLATVTPGALRGDGSLLTFTVAVTGATPTLDFSMMEWNTDPNYIAGLAAPTAAVAGTLGNNGFTAISGQSSTTAPSITAGSGEFAFGWTGLNSDPNTTSWISGYTNKIYGLQAALVTITDTAGTTIAPIAAFADIDGQWQTAVQQQLGAGTYTISMTQYLASDTLFATPIGRTSSDLNLVVSMSDLDLQATAQGLGLDVGDGGTQGNWIAFNAVGSTLPPEATLILYRTNSSGEMIDVNGMVVTDVTDAALAYVGNVQNDTGTTIFNGSQMVYLGVGQELHFAIQTGENDIDQQPSFSATEQPDGTYNLNVGGIQLTAGVNNTLDASSNMASIQRMYDMPLVYLTQGQELSVEVAGSAANTNDLHFVRFEVNAATGEIMVDGVAYGDTDAFHTAVLANLDAGFSASYGGSNFDATQAWTVAGGDGFYAPVLITQSGDIFVPGDGNAGGAEYIRIFGENTFGFEDLTAAQGSDFDYNDMVMRLVPNI